MGKLKEFLIIQVIMKLADRGFRTNISGWYNQIGKMQSSSPDKIKEWQLARLSHLVHTAYDKSPYYHELFNSIGIKPEDIRTFEDLEKIPPLTKDIIRERFDDIKLSDTSGLHFKYCTTGGSTGNPTKYIKDNDSWGFDNAFNIRMWKQVGYHYGDKFLALGSSSLFPVNKKSLLHDWYYRLKGKIPFNAMNLSDERLQACVELIRKEKLHYVYGYASSIFLLAKYVIDKHLGDAVNIKACFPTSEILTDVYRDTIIRAFGCKVVNVYGAHDGGIVACDSGDGFKVSYNCIVQLLEKGVDNGTALLTDVNSLAFPFIRYQLGDVVELGEGYGDIHNGQILKNIIGRTSDIIEMENGRVLTGPGFTILFSQLNVLCYRMYKSGPMELTVEVVKDTAYSKTDDDLLTGTIKKHAGDDCNIVIKYVDSVKQRENGKNMFFLNDRDYGKQS